MTAISAVIQWMAAVSEHKNNKREEYLSSESKNSMGESFRTTRTHVHLR